MDGRNAAKDATGIVDAGAGPAGKLDLGILDQTFGYLLRRATRDVERRFQFYFRTVELTAPQFAIMILIERNADCTPGDLVQPIGISQNNLVGIIGDLVERGYVRKETDARDRRARILSLTDAGREALATAHEAHSVYMKEYLDRVGEGNLAQLVRLLRMFDRG